MALGTWLKTFMTAGSAATAAAAIGARTGSDAPTATAAELRIGTQSAVRAMSPLLLKDYVSTQGTTASRPTDATVGFTYYDTTLGKPVWLKTAPSTWVDATGTAA
jgi:hypothetical protein